MKKTLVYHLFSPTELYPKNTSAQDLKDNILPWLPSSQIELLDCFVRLLYTHGHHYPIWFAKQLGLPTPILSHTLYALTGYSCRDFIDLYILQLATDLLRKTRLPVSKIARRCGFPRSSELSQFLERVARCTPTGLRYSS